MRPITWAAALLALFVATEAKAQDYTIPRPIYMPNQVHNRCATCGTCCNGYCSFRAFFTPTVDVNGCPYGSTDPCTHSLIDEIACDVYGWAYACQNFIGFSVSSVSVCDTCGESSCTCGESEEPILEEDAPIESPPPPPIPDEEVDPFLDDPTAAGNSRVYRISSPDLIEIDSRNINQDHLLSPEASSGDEPLRALPPLMSRAPVFTLTPPANAHSSPTITITDRQ